MAQGLGILRSLLYQDRAHSRVAHRPLGSEIVKRFIENGLGPMLHELLVRGRVTVDAGSARDLAGSDLAALAIYDRTAASLKQVLRSLNDQGIRPVLLKGACFAPRYYPKAHWRVMADVDLLVAPAEVERADRTLREAGFLNPSVKRSSAWVDHHHLAPLFHPDLRIWVEVHRRLFRHNSPFSEVPIFQTTHILETCSAVREYDADVAILPDDLNLSYLACHWYWALIAGVGPHSARALIDAALLLSVIQDPSISRWLTDDEPGTAVAVLLLALIREELIRVRERDLWRGLHGKRHGRARAVRFLTALVRRRVVPLKPIKKPLMAQLMGEWFRRLLDPRAQRSVLLTVAGTAASRFATILNYKIRGVDPESCSDG